MNKLVLKELFMQVAVTFLTLTSIVIFWERNLLLSFILLGVLIAANIFWYKKFDFLIFISAMVMGTFVDMFVASFGVWEFENPSFFFVPLWLPIAWVIAANVLIKNYDTLKKLLK